MSFSPFNCSMEGANHCASRQRFDVIAFASPQAERSFRGLLIAAAMFAVPCVGCRTSAAAGNGNVGGATSGDEVPCAGAERPSGAVCLGEVVGRVVDEKGDPVPDLPVTVCGPVCYRGVSDQAGAYAVRIERFVLVSEYSVQAHGSPSRSTFYHSLGLQELDGDYDLGTLTVVDLPEDGGLFVTKLDLDGGPSPSQSVASGAIHIDVPQEVVVRLSVADSLKGEEGKRFRARELDTQLSQAFVKGSAYSRVFALGPFEGEFLSDAGQRGKAGLRIDNRDGWPAGTEVPLFALGTYLDPSWLTPAHFESIGTGVVSEDEAEIELPPDAPGPGLSHLTWLAVGTPRLN